MKINGYKVYGDPHKLHSGFYIKNIKGTKYHVLELTGLKADVYSVGDYMVDINDMEEEKISTMLAELRLPRTTEIEYIIAEFLSFWNTTPYNWGEFNMVNYDNMKKHIEQYGIKILKEKPKDDDYCIYKGVE